MKELWTVVVKVTPIVLGVFVVSACLEKQVQKEPEGSIVVIGNNAKKRGDMNWNSRLLADIESDENSLASRSMLLDDLGSFDVSTLMKDFLPENEIPSSKISWIKPIPETSSAILRFEIPNQSLALANDHWCPVVQAGARDARCLTSSIADLVSDSKIPNAIDIKDYVFLDSKHRLKRGNLESTSQVIAEDVEDFYMDGSQNLVWRTERSWFLLGAGELTPQVLASTSDLVFVGKDKKIYALFREKKEEILDHILYEWSFKDKKWKALWLKPNSTFPWPEVSSIVWGDRLVWRHFDRVYSLGRSGVYRMPVHLDRHAKYLISGGRKNLLIRFLGLETKEPVGSDDSESSFSDLILARDGMKSRSVRDLDFNQRLIGQLCEWNEADSKANCKTLLVPEGEKARISILVDEDLAFSYISEGQEKIGILKADFQSDDFGAFIKRWDSMGTVQNLRFFAGEN